MNNESKLLKALGSIVIAIGVVFISVVLVLSVSYLLTFPVLWVTGGSRILATIQISLSLLILEALFIATVYIFGKKENK